MAGYDLIDAYLGELAERLRWRRDVEELIDELGDHLWATVEGLELAVLGLNRRHGGIGLAGVGAVICAFLAVGLSLVGWFVIGWALLVALAAGLVGVGAIRVDIAPRVSAAAFAGAWTIATVAWGVMRALQVDGPDRWGNYPVVDLTARLGLC
jgi:hypothetical protein